MSAPEVPNPAAPHERGEDSSSRALAPLDSADALPPDDDTGVHEWTPPRRSDSGLLIIHGAGTHERITTLYEILNPTLKRLQDEGNLIATSAVLLGRADLPGGRYDGLTIEYKPDPTGQPDTARTLFALEARWDKSYIDPPLKEISAWSAVHAARIGWELLLFQARDPLRFAIALLLVGLISLGAALMRDSQPAGVTCVVLAWLLAYAFAFAETRQSWNHYEERLGAPAQRGQAGRPAGDGEDPAPDRASHASRWWTPVAATTLAIYHVQRGVVIVVLVAGILGLPVLAGVVRLLGTIPGLDAIARNLISKFERWALQEAPTDAAIISDNPIAASAIQARARLALREIEERLDDQATLTIIAHSAAAPIAWWLLSEPGIHARQKQRAAPLRYRLITVAGNLNWSKRGMDSRAMPLDMELVNGDRENVEQRTYWANLYTAWDPAPHGPVRINEFHGTWSAWHEQEPLAPREPSRLMRIWHRAFGSLFVTSTEGGSPPPGPPNPNLIVRNLGSPISAEHSEYFRNQQECVPLFVRAIDDDVSWAHDDASEASHERYANLRLALISPLVRARMILFALPLAMLLNARRGESPSTVCPDQESWVPLDAKQVADVNDLLDKIPIIDAKDRVCIDQWGLDLVDLLWVLAAAVIAYALVEVYTSFCWQILGRRVHSLDPRKDTALRTETPPRPWYRVRRLCWPPSNWRMGALPVLSALIVWIPTVLAWLVFWPVYSSQSALIWSALTIPLAMAEMFWLEQCMSGIREPHTRHHGAVPLGFSDPWRQRA